MKVDVIPVRELSDYQIQRWREIIGSDPRLNSPYFCPEFFQILGSVRNDIFVSAITMDERIVAFFPFQKKRFGMSVPAGGKLSDIHGFIAEKGSNFDIKEILKMSGLVSYEFFHIPLWQECFIEYISYEETFHTISLKNGYQEYIDFLTAKKSKTLKDSAYKLRKLSRDYEKVVFRHYVNDLDIIETLFEWKSQQYKSSNLVDVFSFDWTKEFLRTISSYHSESFSGVLSVLEVNDVPIAIHVGMRSGKTWNWWFPRHDNSFKKYSPGILLRLNAIEKAASEGLLNVDLGCGDENTYKPHISTNTELVGAGIVELPSFFTSIRKAFYSTERFIKKTFLYHIVKLPGRYIFYIIRRRKFK